MAAAAQFALVLLLAASTLFAQRPGPRGRDGGGKRGGRPPQLMLERWNRMPPSERKRLLDTLPPERREQLENRMQHFNELSPEEKNQLSERYRAFRRMPPETQERARRLFRRFNQLPDERRPLVRREFDRLRVLRDEERRARMDSGEFREQYRPSEQEFLQELMSVVAPPPGEPEKSTEKHEP